MTIRRITPFLWFDTQAEDAARAARVFAAMMQMQKVDIQALEDAAAG